MKLPPSLEAGYRALLQASHPATLDGKAERTTEATAGFARLYHEFITDVMAYLERDSSHQGRERRDLFGRLSDFSLEADRVVDGWLTANKLPASWRQLARHRLRLIDVMVRLRGGTLFAHG